MRRILLILSIVSLLSCLLFSQTGESIDDNIVARVGRQNITNQQLSQRITAVSEREENASLSYLQRRELALEELIKEELLLHFASERGIRVSMQEVDDYFRVLYGDHERVTTNGAFDPRKYRELKRLPEIRDLLNDLRRDLLLDKAESVVKSLFHYTESDLIDRFFLENTDIDLSYVIMDEESISLPFTVNPMQAYDFYRQNRDNYPEVKEFYIEFFVVPFSDMRKRTASMNVTEEQVSKYVASADISLLNRLLVALETRVAHDSFEISEDISSELKSIILNQDSEAVYRIVSEIIKDEESQRMTYEEAVMTSSRLRDRLTVDYELFSITVYDHPFDDRNPSLFKQNNLLPAIRQIGRGRYSQPIKTDFGYLVIRVADQKNNKEGLPDPLAKIVWQDFVRNEQIVRHEDQLRELYQSTIDSQITSAVYVTRLVIDKNFLRTKEISEDKLYRFFRENRSIIPAGSDNVFFEGLQEEIRQAYYEDEIKSLQEWAIDNVYRIGYQLQSAEGREFMPGITGSNELVYLEKHVNEDPLNELISIGIDNRHFSKQAFVEDDKFIVFYLINSYYPDYLPGFEELKNHFYEQYTHTIDTDEEDYLDYYLSNETFFMSSDSLRLAGIFYPWKSFPAHVTEQELKDYYEQRKDHLYTEHRYTIEYIKINDPEIIRKELVTRISEWLSQGVDLQILQEVFGIRSNILKDTTLPPVRNDIRNPKAPQTITVNRSQLPDEFNNILSVLALSEISSPVYYEDSWYLFKKVREQPPRQASYQEMRLILSEELSKETAEKKAHQLASDAFIEITTLSDLYLYPDTLQVFTTNMKRADATFGPLGDISAYRTRLLNLRKNGRLNTIFVNEDGCGIVFVLDKYIGEHLSFEEALPHVKAVYHSDSKTHNAQSYAGHVRDLIISGEDPSLLLVFWGGWHSETNLSFNDVLPGVQYSGLIIESASKRNEGDLSHIIRNGNREYLFYRLDRKKSVDMDSYLNEKDSYRESVIYEDFMRWISNYGNQLGIEKF